MTRRRRAEYTQEALQVNAENPGNSGYSTQIPGQHAAVAPKESRPYKRDPGEVPEWSIGTVSKGAPFRKDLMISMGYRFF